MCNTYRTLFVFINSQINRIQFSLQHFFSYLWKFIAGYGI
ncbi:hypothetical protein HMPREF9446_01672 [Bacteroides fluxus YIT 12057]|uniref:Uncharacterized protein n=1 Tax=Bacteroides fluxus YIT 12057 TaxID=763034 RepID=F3PSD8_9BACE|nr:hypothetical protein HMPREF9446_01672 [Bacteroides fluxus YIT 12057]